MANTIIQELRARTLSRKGGSNPRQLTEWLLCPRRLSCDKCEQQQCQNFHVHFTEYQREADWSVSFDRMTDFDSINETVLAFYSCASKTTFVDCRARTERAGWHLQFVERIKTHETHCVTALSSWVRWTGSNSWSQSDNDDTIVGNPFGQNWIILSNLII